jgi:hypothetical protein
MSSKIKWESAKGSGDYTAKEGGYTLRSEMMSRGLWWWCCYCPDGSQIDVYTQDKWAKTKIQAQELAMQSMLEHKAEKKK